MLNSHDSVSLLHRSLVFLAAFVAIHSAIYVSQFIQSRSSRDPAAHTDYALVENAKLVDHFCLSRIPPLLGKSTVPTEWETALNCDIEFADAIGDLVSSSSPLSTRLAEIKELEPGKSVSANSTVAGVAYAEVVHRSSGNPNIFLYLKRTTSASPFSARVGMGGALWTNLLISAGGALLLMLLTTSALLRRR